MKSEKILKEKKQELKVLKERIAKQELDETETN